MNDKPTQLTLGIRLSNEARFDNYLVSDANKELVESLLAPDSAHQFIYIRAPAGSGLTHLLQAVCHEECHDEGHEECHKELRRPAIYLPMAERHQFDPAVLEGASSLSLVCIDDLGAIAGDRDWERALFNAVNELLAGNVRLVIGAREAPQDLPLQLEDLKSRLQLAPVFRLNTLDDEDKKRLLRLQAKKRGINLSLPVAEFIVNRTERSLHSLMAVLDKLDASSLTHRRSLTIPLVKETMGW